MKIRLFMILLAFLMTLPMQLSADEGTVQCEVNYVYSCKDVVLVNFENHHHDEAYRLKPAVVGQERFDLMFSLLLSAVKNNQRVWAKWDKDHNLVWVSLYNDQ